MNMITKLATKMLAMLSVVVMIAPPAAAQGLSASDMAFAFGGKAAAPAAVQQTARAAAPKAAEPVVIASARGMTQTEMQDTEGAWLFHVVRHGGGAVLGGYGAGYGYLAGGGRSPRGFVGHVAAGIGAGFFSPVSGLRSAGLSFGGGFTGGGISSFGSSRGWW
ncbi:MAG: hypothetical protein ACK46Q_10750 [Hyphomonas sp.]